MAESCKEAASYLLAGVKTEQVNINGQHATVVDITHAEFVSINSDFNWVNLLMKCDNQSQIYVSCVRDNFLSVVQDILNCILSNPSQDLSHDVADLLKISNITLQLAQLASIAHARMSGTDNFIIKFTPEQTTYSPFVISSIELVQNTALPHEYEPVQVSPDHKTPFQEVPEKEFTPSYDGIVFHMPEVDYNLDDYIKELVEAG